MVTNFLEPKEKVVIWFNRKTGEISRMNYDDFKHWLAYKCQIRPRYQLSDESIKRKYAKTKEWQARNSGKMLAYSNKRRANKIKATPIWADLDAIKDVYLEAEYQQMHVDHAIPLKGKNVCGLHVWDNLQLLTAKENLQKRNKLLECY